MGVSQQGCVHRALCATQLLTSHRSISPHLRMQAQRRPHAGHPMCARAGVLGVYISKQVLSDIPSDTDPASRWRLRMHEPLPHGKTMAHVRPVLSRLSRRGPD